MNLPAGLVRLTRPLTLAVLSGRADPPFPRSRRLGIPIPRFLGLLPFRTVDLVVLANLLIFWLAYSGGLSSLLSGNDSLSIPYPEWQIYYAAAACSLPLLLREHWPLAAWRISAAGMLTTAPIMDALTGHPVSIAGIVAYLLVVYSVAVRCGRETTLGAWIASMLCMALSTTSRDDLVIAAVLLSVTALFGYNVRARRLAAKRLAEEEQRSERALAAQATLEERARIARELHDVVAHHMSVIAIQAEAVPLQAAGDAGRLEEGLREIRALSLAAMTEMRRVVAETRNRG